MLNDDYIRLFLNNIFIGLHFARKKLNIFYYTFIDVYTKLSLLKKNAIFSLFSILLSISNHHMCVMFYIFYLQYNLSFYDYSNITFIPKVKLTTGFYSLKVLVTTEIISYIFSVKKYIYTKNYPKKHAINTS